MRAHHVEILPGEFAICRLPASAPLPARAGDSSFLSITRTTDELSIICPAGEIPADAKHERGWRVLKLRGPFPFTETGILASILTPLADAKIGILAVSTFDTDYVLVKAAQLDAAATALREAGHKL